MTTVRTQVGAHKLSQNLLAMNEILTRKTNDGMRITQVFLPKAIIEAVKYDRKIKKVRYKKLKWDRTKKGSKRIIETMK